MEEQIVENPLTGEEESKNENKIDYWGDLLKGILHLRTYEGVSKFKSIRRAIKRGHVAITGEVFPRRPFHNKKNTCKRKGKHSRAMNELKKKIYEQIKHRKLQ